jgi:hypothetical protein
LLFPCSAAAREVRSEAQAAARAAAAAEEAAGRKIAGLNTRVQQLESQLHRAAADAEAVREQRAAAAAAGDAAAAGAALELRCSALEAELRKSKRREEKLQALQFRLREDVKSSGGDVGSFDQLRDVRALEYEMDRLANRASREKAQLREALAEAQKRAERAEGAAAKAAAAAGGGKRALGGAGSVLADKENQLVM